VDVKGDPWVPLFAAVVVPLIVSGAFLLFDQLVLGRHVFW